MPEQHAQAILDQDVVRPEKARKVLVFLLNDKEYAVDIGQTREVLDVSSITRIPYMPDFLKGAMNLRGEILSVLDIRPFCGLPAGRRGDSARIIVTDVTGSVVGILVDRVKGTLEIVPDQVQAPLSTLDERIQCHVVGQVRLEDRIVVWLDFRSLLQSEAVTRLQKMTSREGSKGQRDPWL